MMFSTPPVLIRPLFLVLPLFMASGCNSQPTAQPVAEGPVEHAPGHTTTAHSHDAAPLQSDANAPASAKAAAPASSLTPEARTAVGEILSAYEQLRAQLAADKADGVIETATQLEQAANRAAALVSTPLQARVQAIALSASHVKQVQGKNLEELRTAFGHVSRSIILLISAEPALEQGLNVIECPMATGFKKWVQPSDTVSNPYMGTKMLTCGVKSTWSE